MALYEEAPVALDGCDVVQAALEPILGIFTNNGHQ